MRGITHTGRTDKTSVSFTWTAPPEGAGEVIVLFSVAQTQTIYWPRQFATTLQGFYVCTIVDTFRTSTIHISTCVICNMLALAMCECACVFMLPTVTLSYPQGQMHPQRDQLHPQRIQLEMRILDQLPTAAKVRTFLIEHFTNHSCVFLIMYGLVMMYAHCVHSCFTHG